MSQDEVFKGKLIPTGLTLIEVMKDIEFPTNYDRNEPDDVYELFMDKFYREKVIIDNQVYDVEKTDIDCYDIFEATQDPTGNISFIVKYYNGGCSFDEAIERAVDKMKNNGEYNDGNNT